MKYRALPAFLSLLVSVISFPSFHKRFSFRNSVEYKPKTGESQGNRLRFSLLEMSPSNHQRRNITDIWNNPLSRRIVFASTSLALIQFYFSYAAFPLMKPGFKRVGLQYIAALGDPESTEGSNANDWGVWTVDPGPRGVPLDAARRLEANGVSPVGWKFDTEDWWLEEHGLIMESPIFPLPSGRYMVTGGRFKTAILTVDKAGRWKLDEGKLIDVTHLPCRAARYKGGSPTNAKRSDFPVEPGHEMPEVLGSRKQDYAVVFLIGVPECKKIKCS